MKYLFYGTLIWGVQLCWLARGDLQGCNSVNSVVQSPIEFQVDGESYMATSATQVMSPGQRLCLSTSRGSKSVSCDYEMDLEAHYDRERSTDNSVTYFATDIEVYTTAWISSCKKKTPGVPDYMTREKREREELGWMCFEHNTKSLDRCASKGLFGDGSNKNIYAFYLSCWFFNLLEVHTYQTRAPRTQQLAIRQRCSDGYEPPEYVATTLAGDFNFIYPENRSSVSQVFTSTAGGERYDTTLDDIRLGLRVFEMNSGATEYIERQTLAPGEIVYVPPEWQVIRDGVDDDPLQLGWLSFGSRDVATIRQILDAYTCQDVTIPLVPKGKVCSKSSNFQWDYETGEPGKTRTYAYRVNAIKTYSGEILEDEPLRIEELGDRTQGGDFQRMSLESGASNWPLLAAIPGIDVNYANDYSIRYSTPNTNTQLTYTLETGPLAVVSTSAVVTSSFATSWRNNFNTLWVSYQFTCSTDGQLAVLFGNRSMLTNCQEGAFVEARQDELHITSICHYVVRFGQYTPNVVCDSFDVIESGWDYDSDLGVVNITIEFQKGCFDNCGNPLSFGGVGDFVEEVVEETAKSGSGLIFGDLFSGSGVLGTVAEILTLVFFICLGCICIGGLVKLYRTCVPEK